MSYTAMSLALRGLIGDSVAPRGPGPPSPSSPVIATGAALGGSLGRLFTLIHSLLYLCLDGQMDRYKLHEKYILTRVKRKSNNKLRSIKGQWKFLLLFGTFCFTAFWFWHTDIESPRIVESAVPDCSPGFVASKAAALIKNYSRDHPIFLQLSDIFWPRNETLYQLPYGTYKSEKVMMKFLTLANTYHIPPEIERLPCKKCVVVGSGFSLNNSSLGEEINKYDIVIRLNNAPVHKYQQDVGNKTTMRLFYPESATFNQFLDVNPDTLLVLVPFKALDLEWMKIFINDEERDYKKHPKMPKIKWQLGTQNIRVLNPYFMEVAATKMLRHNKKIKLKPTTGFLAISFALHFCDVVHIAGFGYPPVSVNNTQPIHYYNLATLKNVAKAHSVVREASILRKLLLQKVIRNLTYF
uniref:ST3 beta-galactoside alpha-2,3-sialyltransferase 4 n=1 Tax=Leptobrachium leishanense TaxID=445787 RepID=A0A8C5WED5_9ANUR